MQGAASGQSPVLHICFHTLSPDGHPSFFILNLNATHSGYLPLFPQVIGNPGYSVQQYPHLPFITLVTALIAYDMSDIWKVETVLYTFGASP